MADTPVLRKVQLDSIDDLRFIYENLVKAAREKIELHVPPSAAPGEEGGSARKGSKRATRRSTGGAGGGGAGAVVDGGGGGKGVDGSAAGEGGDPLKRKVEELVMEYITQTFDLAAPSISVNGLDATSTSTVPGSTAQKQSILDLLKADTDEFEPYDRALHTRLQSLYADIETTTLRVAHQRRQIPEKALRRYEKALNHEVEKDFKLLEQIAKEGEEERRARGLPEIPLPPMQAADAMEGVEVQVERKQEVGGEKLDEKYLGMVGDWERSMGVMEELSRGLPATAHKLERAKAALEYLHEKEMKKKRGLE